MEFGVPKEIRDMETRVALTPSGVMSYATRPTVYVEQKPVTALVSAIRNIRKPR